MLEAWRGAAWLVVLTGLQVGFAAEPALPRGGMPSPHALAESPSVASSGAGTRASFDAAEPPRFPSSEIPRSKSTNLPGRNLPPIPSAGMGLSLREIPAVIGLDGSHSLDPENLPLTYEWRQTGGPSVTLAGPRTSRPSFQPAGPGVYDFELTVGDAFDARGTDFVRFYLGRVAPVADAGTTRYAARGRITLDGSGSFAPNTDAPLEYSWTVVGGLAVTLLPTNIAKPNVIGFTQAATNREVEFELVVRADGLISAPSRVKAIVVPSWSNPPLTLINGPFKTNRPTIFGFGGGDCSTGFGMSEFTSNWLSRANIFTESYTRDSASSAGAPGYSGYGDQLIVTLSAAAPGYDRPIQTIGYSTGCMPACDVAERLNIRYGDPRYRVNRVTLIDSGCSRDYTVNIDRLVSNRAPGTMFWVENYYSVAGRFRRGSLNAEFPVPPADHGTPNAWYVGSWNLATPYHPSDFNDGAFAGAFFSVIGPGKNYQLETGRSEYYFGWRPPITPASGYRPGNLVPMSPSLYPARLPGVVELVGPTNGTLAAGGQIRLSCQPVVNATKYEILLGPDASHVDRVAWEGEMPPDQALAGLPFFTTWWTIRATDAYGTASWGDPRWVVRDSDQDHLPDASEIRTHGTDPEDPDTDHDGRPDGLEVEAGTDPLRSEGGVRLTYRMDASGSLRLSWRVEANQSSDLEYAATLGSTSWHVLRTFAAPSATDPIEHVIATSGAPGGFYRVRAYGSPASGAHVDTDTPDARDR